MTNIEVQLVSELSGLLDVPVSVDVPPNRPDEFVTVNATGGAVEDGVMRPNVALQAWSTTTARASALAYVADAAIRSLPATSRAITSVEGSVPYSWPSDDGVPRYQVYYNLVAHI